MLGVAEVLGNSSAPGAFQRRIVFAALAGEPWGYMGSKRLLWAMNQSQASVAGIPLHLIDQVQPLILPVNGPPFPSPPAPVIPTSLCRWLLWGMHQSQASVAGIPLHRIDQVLPSIAGVNSPPLLCPPPPPPPSPLFSPVTSADSSIGP